MIGKLRHAMLAAALLACIPQVDGQLPEINFRIFMQEMGEARRISIGTNFVYDVERYYDVNTAGYDVIGHNIPMQVYSLQSTTGNPDDYDSIPAQIMDYAFSPHRVLAFPATENSTWSSNWTSRLEFFLNVQAFSYNNTPARVVTHSSSVDTIIGWGTVAVPAEHATAVSADYEVLIQRTTVTNVDSFYVNGSPAPANVLTAFGVSQAQSNDFTIVRIWRSGSSNPLMQVFYPPNNSTTPVAAVYDSVGQKVSGLLNIAQAQPSSLYPNPGSGQSLQLHFALEMDAEFVLFDMKGRQVYRQPLSASASDKHVISPATSWNAGLYLYQVRDARGVALTQGIWTSSAEK